MYPNYDVMKRAAELKFALLNYVYTMRNKINYFAVFKCVSLK